MNDELPIQVERDYVMKWRLSARASAMIAKTAIRFKSSIEIKYGDEFANAKQIVNLLELGWQEFVGEMIKKESETGIVLDDLMAGVKTGLKAGSHIKITARGADAADALAAIVDLLSRDDLDFG